MTWVKLQDSIEETRSAASRVPLFNANPECMSKLQVAASQQMSRQAGSEYRRNQGVIVGRRKPLARARGSA